jgi:hypothetical protein
MSGCGTTRLVPRALASGWWMGRLLAGAMVPVDRGSETWGCTRWVGESCKGTVRENRDGGFAVERWLIVEERRGKGTEGGEDGML